MRDLEIALQKYFNDYNPVPLDMLLLSPNTLLDSEILPDNHELISEAITILDSLNSYNQGISNDDLESELLAINEESPFYSWRCGALAIKEFYNENKLLMTEYLNDIRENSPVKELIKYMYRGESPLYSFNNELNSSIDSLKDVISNTLSDMYKDTVKLIFSDLNNLDKETLSNIALTIIEESVDTIPLDIIQSSLIAYVGLTESIRLMALGTAFNYPIKSIQYWFCYITELNFETIEDPILKCLIKIILDMIKALIKEGYKFTDKDEKTNFIEAQDLFLNDLGKLQEIPLKSSTNPLTNLKKALSFDTLVKKEDKTNTFQDLQGELF